MNAPNLLSVIDALRRIREGSLTSAELLQACLRQIERLNPTLNAFITVCSAPDEQGDSRLSRPIAVEGAARQGAFPCTGQELPLQGIPIAVKALFETANIRTTSGSLFSKDYVPTQDVRTIERVNSAGGLIIGKTNMHEIALGLTTLNPHFGACLNPWDTTRAPGGSSGGSAMAVATGMALAALGSDTGGSIRIPAALLRCRGPQTDVGPRELDRRSTTLMEP